MICLIDFSEGTEWIKVDWTAILPCALDGGGGLRDCEAFKATIVGFKRSCSLALTLELSLGVLSRGKPPTEMQGLKLGILPGLQATFCREQEQVKLGFRRYCARECLGNSTQNLCTASIQSQSKGVSCISNVFPTRRLCPTKAVPRLLSNNIVSKTLVSRSPSPVRRHSHQTSS